MIPFETPRLLLRELTPDDAAFAFELNNDPLVLQFTGDAPFSSVEEARTFLQNYSDYQRNGFGRWGVELKTTGKLIGWCGLKRNRDTGEVDLGYRFIRSAWNKGYATEASKACLETGLHFFGLTEIIARAMQNNPASYRVMEKLGFSYVETVEDEGQTWLVYRISLSPK